MLTLEYPYALLLIILPLLIIKLPVSKVNESLALLVPHFNEIINIKSSSKISKTSLTAKILLLLIWVLSCIALADPKWVGDPIELPRKGRDILLAIDVSDSMSITDMQISGRTTDRLSVVKLVANKFVDKRVGDRIGLILFGSKAYLQTPLTFDRKTIKNMIDDTTIKLAGPLTAIGDAVGLAIKRLRTIESESKVLVLLTDGFNNSGMVDPLQASEMAKKNNIKIYTVGLGADRLQIRGLLGTETINPSADLDEDTLKTIAKNTEGKFFRAFNLEDLEEVYSTIDKLEPNEKEAGAYRPEKQLLHFPMFIALLLSLILLLRKLTPLGRYI